MLMDQLDTAFPALSTTALGSKAAIEGLNYCNNKVIIELFSNFLE